MFYFGKRTLYFIKFKINIVSILILTFVILVERMIPIMIQLIWFHILKRKDSDITSVYYGESGLSWSNESDPNFDFGRFSLETRNGFAAALISDCSDLVRRLDYIKEIKKYIQVDLYGRCSGVACPFEGEECRKWLASSYKFYFAFENSVCNDYITEKLFATLRYDVIPIVLGGGDYTR